MGQGSALRTWFFATLSSILAICSPEAGACRVAFHSSIGMPWISSRACALSPGKAVAAESGQPHQIDVLRVVAVLQMADEAAEYIGRDFVGKLVERVVRGRIVHRRHSGFAIVGQLPLTRLAPCHASE